MEFSYYGYLIAACLLLLLLFYKLLSMAFPKLRLQKEQVIPVMIAEQIHISELSKFGPFWYDKALDHLANTVELRAYSLCVHVDPEHSYELTFQADRKEISPLQIRTFQDVLSFDESFYHTMLQAVCNYYNTHYYEEGGDAYWRQKKTIETLKSDLELDCIMISREGETGFRFRVPWDEEHGLGVLVKEGEVVEVGGGEVVLFL